MKIAYLFHLLMEVTQYTAAETSRTAADPRWVRGGEVSGIAGASKQFSARVSGLVLKTLDCTHIKLQIKFTPITMNREQQQKNMYCNSGQKVIGKLLEWFYVIPISSYVVQNT